MAAAVARHAIAGLEPYLHRSALYDVQLLVSELVTNSIRHGDLPAGASVEVCLRASPDTVMVEVADQGRGFEGRSPYPDKDPPAAEKGSGWGLFLVEQLSDRWGVIDDNGTRVWFELRPGARRGRKARVKV